MQDAEFKEAGAVHPIGKSIFVFAGGTRASYQAFLPAALAPGARSISISTSTPAISSS